MKFAYIVIVVKRVNIYMLGSYNITISSVNVIYLKLSYKANYVFEINMFTKENERSI